MLKVGSIEKIDGGYAINRGWYRQGYVFKDEDAYKNRKYDPCYVPELSDNVYTAFDFLSMCHGQQEFADELFEGVDWQHPESQMEDWIANNEWVICEGCNRLVDYGDGCNDKKCPYCGKEIEEE